MAVKTKAEQSEAAENTDAQGHNNLDVQGHNNPEAQAVEERIREQDFERVPYFVRKPEGLARSETHFVVTLNGKNYRYAYNTELMIPRCIREILESKARMQERAENRAAELRTGSGGGVNLGTY
ncbi:MAG: hypothetical protein Q4G33_09405 [bacterium]|nr:hypothetical protein [bacterium]